MKNKPKPKVIVLCISRKEKRKTPVRGALESVIERVEEQLGNHLDHREFELVSEWAEKLVINAIKGGVK